MNLRSVGHAIVLVEVAFIGARQHVTAVCFGGPLHGALLERHEQLTFRADVRSRDRHVVTGVQQSDIDDEPARLQRLGIGHHVAHGADLVARGIDDRAVGECGTVLH